MAKKISPWLVGCGIGCAGLVVLAVAVVGTGAFFVRRTVSGFAEAVETRQELERKFGAADEFQPWTDGAIPSQRMEAFLTVREASMPARNKIARAFEELPIDPEEAEKIESLPFWQKMRKVISISQSGLGMGKSMGDLFQARNDALLREEMGLGEYTFIYVQAYHSWLKHPPEEGFTSRASGGVRVELGRFERKVRQRMLKMLESQLAVARPESWKQQLAAELEAMKADPKRVPWADGVPEPLASSLAPYRQRLEETYNPLTNEIELGLNRKQGWGSYQLD